MSADLLGGLRFVKKLPEVPEYFAYIFRVYEILTVSNNSHIYMCVYIYI